MPTIENPVRRTIERFLERHLGSRLDQHADPPLDVLGETVFRKGAPPEVRINRVLTGSAFEQQGGDPRREYLATRRATLAHEAGHVMLHRCLFDVDDAQGSLWADHDSSTEPPVRCLKRDVGHRAGPHDWREVQANAAMAALLMPASVFTSMVSRARAALGHEGPIEIDSPVAVELASRLAPSFLVSKQAAEIRLNTLKIVTPAGQRPLADQ